MKYERVLLYRRQGKQGMLRRSGRVHLAVEIEDHPGFWRTLCDRIRVADFVQTTTREIDCATCRRRM